MFGFGTKNKTKKHLRGPAFIETLETRTLLSVTVSQYYPGFYDVSFEGSSTIASIEVDQYAELMTVDGQQYENVQYIWFHCNNLGDYVHINSNNAFGYIGCSIDGGSGNDDLSIRNMGGAIHGYGGTDTLSLNNSWYGEVYGDDDAYSYINVSGNCVGSQICAGTGGSRINCIDSDYGVNVYGGEGNDWILGSRYNDQIFCGGGADTVFGVSGNDTYMYMGNGSTVYGTQAYGGDDQAIVSIGTNVTLNGVAHAHYV